MRRILVGFGLVVLLAPVLTVLVPVVSAQHVAVTICHRTGSSSNPFVIITTDNNAIIQAHLGTSPHPPLGGRADVLAVNGECGGGEEEGPR
jgi:hypothetical protein